jgi:hypothetical protein
MRPPQPTPTSVWYSICSGHGNNQTEETCPRCQVGQWIDPEDPYEKLLHWLWVKSPKLWREWVNAEDAPEPEQKKRRWLESVFPRLGRKK